MNPALLLADEPTGKLVCKSAGVVFDQLRKLNREHRTAILFATHNAPLADQRDGIIEVVEGMIPASPIPVEAR